MYTVYVSAGHGSLNFCLEFFLEENLQKLKDKNSGRFHSLLYEYR